MDDGLFRALDRDFVGQLLVYMQQSVSDTRLYGILLPRICTYGILPMFAPLSFRSTDNAAKNEHLRHAYVIPVEVVG